jgi:transcriptional regulator with XRE-family HTH domain
MTKLLSVKVRGNQTPLYEKTRQVLRQMVHDQQLSHGAIAKASGMSATTVTRVLTGERQITLRNLMGFSMALKAKASEIVATAETWDYSTNKLPKALR